MDKNNLKIFEDLIRVMWFLVWCLKPELNLLKYISGKIKNQNFESPQKILS